MSPDVSLSCPCGEPAPDPLPAAGGEPAGCAVCGTPLVQPGGVAREDVERAVGLALLLASVLAVAWMFAARTSGGSAHIVLPIAGLLIGLAARMGAGTRGPEVQRTAGFSFVGFLVFGEVLLYRGALLPRLVALHEAEGASNAEVLAQQEIAGMEVSQYLHVELTLTLFVGFAVGLFLALFVTRAPMAVAAFARRDEPEPLIGEGPTPDPLAGPAAGPEDGSEDQTDEGPIREEDVHAAGVGETESP